MPHQDKAATEMKHSQKVIRMTFVSRNKSPKVLKPTEQKGKGVDELERKPGVSYTQSRTQRHWREAQARHALTTWRS